MALKEQVSNVYGVGLRNVGSYQVAGVPHITSVSINVRAETSISFPQVTKNITIKKTSVGGELRLHFLPKGTQKNALDFKDVNANSTIDNSFTVAPPAISAGTAFSMGWWYKQTSALAYTGTSFVLWRIPGTPYTMTAKIQYQLNNGGSMIIKSTLKEATGGATRQITQTITGSSYDQAAYHHYFLSVSTTSFKAYLDGQDLGQSSLTLNGGVAAVGSILFPRAVSGSAPVTLAQHTLWDKALSDVEVLELYNSGKYKDPRTHSAATNLDSFLAFDNTLTPADTVDTIRDRVGGMNGTVATMSGETDTAAFVDGPGDFLTGSNVISSNHYIALTDGNPSITLNCKCSKIYLSASGSTQTANVMANMTHIPAGRMYALTGSGIDE